MVLLLHQIQPCNYRGGFRCERGILLLLPQRLQSLLQSDGPVPDPDAGGAGDAVGHRAEDGEGRALADLLGADGAAGLVEGDDSCAWSDAVGCPVLPAALSSPRGYRRGRRHGHGISPVSSSLGAAGVLRTTWCQTNGNVRKPRRKRDQYQLNFSSLVRPGCRLTRMAK